MVNLSRNHLVSILVASFSIAAILIALPCEYKADQENGAGTRTKASTLVPTIIFDSIPPSTFHVFVLSLLFAFTSSLSALLMHDTDDAMGNKSSDAQLLHVVITRCFECSSLAFIILALAVLFLAFLLTAGHNFFAASSAMTDAGMVKLNGK